MSVYTLVANATCQSCDWTAGPGEPDKVQRLAEKHAGAEQHATETVSLPERIKR